MTLKALMWRGLGGGALALAAAGLVLPILPTTPLLLVAAWALARGAPDLRARLDAHDRFGPLLRAWETRRAIPRRGKVAAVAGLAGSWSLLAVSAQHLLAPAVAGLVMVCVGAYVVSRPS